MLFQATIDWPSPLGVSTARGDYTLYYRVSRYYRYGVLRTVLCLMFVFTSNDVLYFYTNLYYNLSILKIVNTVHALVITTVTNQSSIYFISK